MTTLMFERVTIGLGGEGFGWRADRFAEALLERRAATRTPRSATASASSPPTSWRCASPATGR